MGWHGPRGDCGCCGCEVFAVTDLLAIDSTTSEVEVSGDDRTILKPLPDVNWKLTLSVGSDTSNTSGSVLYSLLRDDDSVFATFEWVYGTNPFGTTGAGRRKIICRVDIDGSDNARVEFVADPISTTPSSHWIAMRPEGMLTSFVYYAFNSEPTSPSTIRYQSKFNNVFIPFEDANIPTGLRFMATPSTPTPATPVIALTAERIYIEPVYEDLGCYYGSPYGDDVILTPAKREECPHPVACGTFRDTYSTPRWDVGDVPSFSFDALSPRRTKQYSSCNSSITDVAYNPEISLPPRTLGFFYNCSNPSDPVGEPMTALYPEFDAKYYIYKRVAVNLSATASPQTWYVTASLEIVGSFWKTGTPIETYVYGLLYRDQSRPSEVPTHTPEPCFDGLTLSSSGFVDPSLSPPTFPGISDIISQGLQQHTIGLIDSRIITWRKEVCRFKIPPEITFTSSDILVVGGINEITSTQYLITKVTLTDGVGISFNPGSGIGSMRATMNTESITLDPSAMSLKIISDDETWLPQPFA